MQQINNNKYRQKYRKYQLSVQWLLNESFKFKVSTTSKPQWEFKTLLIGQGLVPWSKNQKLNSFFANQFSFLSPNFGPFRVRISTTSDDINSNSGYERIKVYPKYNDRFGIYYSFQG